MHRFRIWFYCYLLIISGEEEEIGHAKAKRYKWHRYVIIDGKFSSLTTLALYMNEG